MDTDLLLLVKIVLGVLGAVLSVLLPVLGMAAKKWIDSNVDERTLALLMQMVADAVAAAEQQFENNAEKKAFVLRLIKAAAAELKINLSDELLEMILDMLIESQVYYLQDAPKLVFADQTE